MDCCILAFVQSEDSSINENISKLNSLQPLLGTVNIPIEIKLSLMKSLFSLILSTILLRSFRSNTVSSIMHPPRA